MPVLNEKWKSRIRGMPGFPAIRFLRGLARSAKSVDEARSYLWTARMLRQPADGLFQPFPESAADRYPQIFRYIREQIGDGNQARILSFGCSTGEEILSLRGHFPGAHIVGIDINPHNIAICRARMHRDGMDGIAFSVASSAVEELSESFEAILAMAVFRHGELNRVPPPSRCDHRIRFAGFERAVEDLARCLKPRGLLAIGHAMFRFSDTRIAPRFKTVLQANRDSSPLYDRNDCLLPDEHCTAGVFQKLPASSGPGVQLTGA